MSNTNGIGHQLPRLTAIEFAVLEACYEATQRQREMLPLLALTLDVAEDEVFYTWAFRRCKQQWKIEGTEWSCFFHGLECDLHHGEDGRHLRLDFGPGGRVDTFTAWGIFQFITTSTVPWPEFSDLKQHLEQSGEKRDPKVLYEVWDRLQIHGAFEPADPALVDFQKRHSTIGPEGITWVRYPEGTPESVQIDCSVAHRPVLSTIGLRLLKEQALHAVS